MQRGRDFDIRPFYDSVKMYNTFGLRRICRCASKIAVADKNGNLQSGKRIKNNLKIENGKSLLFDGKGVIIISE